MNANFAQIMREIFIERITDLTDAEKRVPVTFWEAQKEIVNLRQKLQDLYNRNDNIPISFFGMVIHQRYIEDVLSFEEACKLSDDELLRQARKLHKAVELAAQKPNSYTLIDEATKAWAKSRK